MNALRKTLARHTGRLRDPRCYQVVALGTLLTFGAFELGIGASASNVAAIFITALGTQWLLTRWLGTGRFDPLSPLITSLSLSLLFRTDTPALAVAAAGLAIGSKFLLRIRGKHVFNPATFGIVALFIASDHAWISTGQWGSATLGGLALISLGMLVLTRARRAETTFAFLATYALIVAGRAMWLGDPVSIPLHQLRNGALLVFAFFMISDPRTTPDSAACRLLFGAIVAAVTASLQFALFQPGAPVIALAACAPLTPLLDALFRDRRYEWANASASPFLTFRKENPHAIHRPHGLGLSHARHCPDRPRLLRLLRREGRYEPVQPCIPGRAGAQR